MRRSDISDYTSLFLQDTPLLDVRSPVEFAKGAFPTAVNHPLMNDDERRQVGICYKQTGQAAAIALGHRLVSDSTRQQRLKRWLDFAHNHPQGYLYCFRGGLRSRTVQNWLRDAGCEYPLVIGGYKAMRHFLLRQFDNPGPLWRLGGQTGTGKTELLVRLIADGYPAINLEGLANHKGSAFGRSADDWQPTPVNFENALAIALLKQRARCGQAPILVEDECRAIGRLSQPLAFFSHFRQQPLLVLTAPFSERVNRIYREYITNQSHAYHRLYGPQGALRHRQALLESLDRIRKRLGGVRHHAIRDTLLQAFERDSAILHKQWIGDLLTGYYDPMYAYQLEQKKDLIVFTGTAEEIHAFVNQRHQY